MNQDTRDKNKIKELIDQLLSFTFDEDNNIRRHALGLKKNLERVLLEILRKEEKKTNQF